MKSAKKPSERLLALDFLRGFFIVVIIVDHLWRWPNLFQYISGRGELWASAAQGFVIISGLLIGYVRGYKSRHIPMWTITKKLVARGVMLYIWMIISTLLLVAATWNFKFNGNMAYIPIPVHDWGTLLQQTFQLNYAHTLTHFLYLYAIFLVISPLVVWLLRKNAAWIFVVCSILLYVIGRLKAVEWMQWQVIFFMPALLGYYFETILARYRSLKGSLKRYIRLGTIAITGITVVWSEFIVLAHEPGTYQSSLFGREPITTPTILLSFVWFFGLLSLFQYALPFLKKWFGWLLLTFGQRSLTAYILHTVPLVVGAILFSATTNPVINTLIATGTLLATWGLLKIPYINKLVPR